ncbi:hypothetical protein GCM10025869_07650 [Homoserinibacter gongjuensis]|uniref:HTH lacI-type domain-containing protein n=1 Tax=Homoserinibacter gongjuensis TaxID=1162968 RepID=A0ABQ6JPN8_9MICO|nr:hypothetical protein GCM10025869_07650 [Homoserinibacter gongjuensis]
MARTAAPRRVTLAQVADEAGVSLSTISKVLNGRPDVSAATRGRVEALLAEHGYLRRKSNLSSTGLIELVFHELEAAWSMEIIRGVEDVASAHGLSVVLTESGSRHAPGNDWVEECCAVARRASCWCSPTCPRSTARRCGRAPSPSSSSIPRATPRPRCPRSARRTGRAGSWPPGTSSSSGTPASPRSPAPTT